MSIYYESQRDGLCRLHSINAYFGGAKISEREFNQYMDEYNILYETKYHVDVKCQDFDCIVSDQKNIVSFILKKYRVYTRYYAINEIYLKNIDIILNILKGDFFFIFNENHIYGVKLHNNWYKVDSLSGVQQIDINCLMHEKNIGFIVPVDIKQEFYHNISLIKSILGTKDIHSIREYLIKKHTEKKILDSLEIPISICIDILETNLSFKKTGNYEPIKQNVLNYNEFITQFSNKRYSDIDLILKYIPDILFQLIQLS